MMVGPIMRGIEVLRTFFELGAEVVIPWFDLMEGVMELPLEGVTDRRSSNHLTVRSHPLHHLHPPLGPSSLYSNIVLPTVFTTADSLSSA